MRKPTFNSRRGFTLIELLVALLILAVLGIMSWRATATALDSRDQIVDVEHRWQRLSRGFALIENNLLQVAERQTPNPNGVYDFNLIKNDAGEQRLIFWRTEANRGARLSGFRIVNGELQLLRWPRNRPNEEADSEVILSGIQRVQWAVSTIIDNRIEWQDAWQKPGLPLGLRITLDIDKVGHVERVFALR